VIKRLDAAQADNDNILGVILSTTTNHSAGAISITRPHGATQEALYRRVLNEAGTRPFEIDYIEMHGTGTQAGDTVEMSAILNVFAPDAPSRSADNPLYVGAVKSNVGHGESASGVTALIKTLLILREQRLPPHVGIKTTINHAFPDLGKRNLRIPFTSTAFPSPSSRGGKRRVLVNNFSAAGGSTACIVEEFPSQASNRNRSDKIVDLRPHHVVSITAKSISSLLKNTENLLDYLVTHPDTSLSDLSYTTTARRIQHPLRTSAVVSTIDQLRERLISLATNREVLSSEKLDGVSFVFTGQGSLYLSLGKELYTMSSQFRSDIIRFDNISRKHGFMSFLALVDGTSQDLRALTPTQTQLGIVVVQLALSWLYQSWGVRPDLVIGHSLGEYAALCVSGVLSINDTLYLVGQRAMLMETKCGMKTHSMLSISASTESVKAVLSKDIEGLDLACINGREEIVLAGPVEHIGRAEQLLAAQSIRCKILDVPFAYHSSQMDSIANLFEEAAQQVTFARPKIPIVSPLLGIVIKDQGLIGPTYLRRHARESVDFYGAIRQCQIEGLTGRTRIWLELGPHPVCVGMIKTILGQDTQVAATLRRNKNPWTTACESLSRLHTMGYNIAWKEYHRDFESGQRLLDLPTYAFDYQNYWIEYKNEWLLNKGIARDSAKAAANAGPRTTTVQRLILEEVNDSKLSLAFESDLADPELHAVISGHMINGSGLCPAV
jgi:iron transport multicopper oxidase